MRVFGVGGKLLKAVHSFNLYGRACVRIKVNVTEWVWVNG